MHFAREMTNYLPGLQLLQIPGPTNVPARVRNAIAQPTIDHRGEAFATLARSIFPDLQRIFGTTHAVAVFPASGTGAWEAALLNTTAAGDEILMAETGHFSSLWFNMAMQLKRRARLLPGDWRRAVQADAINAALRADTSRSIRCVCIVHN
jgi:alanine-glyoxylate transaminase/serine-glyoxylate transaminase/serine-pyruvate transaminase